MLRAVLASVWMSAGLLVLPALVALAAVRPHAHVADPDDRARSLRVGVAATTVGLLTLGASALLGRQPVVATVAAAVLGAAVLLTARRCQPWAVRGAVAWALLVPGAGAFLAWLLHRLLDASLPTWQFLLSAAAWVLLVLATLRLRAPARAAVAARALARRTGKVALPPLRRQLWPLAAMVTAGAVAVVGTSVGLEPEGDRGGGSPVRAGPDPVPPARTSPTTGSAPGDPEVPASPMTGRTLHGLPSSPTTGTTPDPPRASSPPQSRAAGAATISAPPPVRKPDQRAEAGPAQDQVPQSAGHEARTGPARAAEPAAVERRWSSRTARVRSHTPARPTTVVSAKASARPTTVASAKASARPTHRAPALEGTRETGAADVGAVARPSKLPVPRSSTRSTPRCTPRPFAGPSSRLPARPSAVPTSPSPGSGERVDADSWKGLLDEPSDTPVARPTRMWGVMPVDALPRAAEDD